MFLPRVPLFLLFLLAVTIPAQHLIIEDQANRIVSLSISESTQAANATVTRLFINEIYPRISSRLGLESAGKPRQPLLGHDLEEIDRNVRKFMLGTDILKVKIFDKSGLTIFSTDHSQIGQDQSGSATVIAASQGVAASQITYRGKFDAMEGAVSDRNLVSSYIPLRNAAGVIIGVVELYTDRTPVIDRALGGEGHLHPYLLLGNAVQLVLLLFIAWCFRSLVIAAREEHEEVAGRKG